MKTSCRITLAFVAFAGVGAFGSAILMPIVYPKTGWEEVPQMLALGTIMVLVFFSVLRTSRP